MGEYVLFFLYLIVNASIGLLLYKLRLGESTDNRLKGFCQLCSAVLIWTLIESVKLFINPEYYEFIYIFKVMLVIIVPYMTFWFLLNFTESKLTNYKIVKILLIVLPMLDVASLLTNPLHHMYFTHITVPEPHGKPVPAEGILFWIHLSIILLCAAVVYYVLFSYIARNFKKYPLLIITGVSAVVPLLLNSALSYPLFGLSYDLSSVGFFMTIMLFAFFSYVSKAKASAHKNFSDTLIRITKSQYLSSGDLNEAAAVIAAEGCTAINAQCVSIWSLSNYGKGMELIAEYSVDGFKHIPQDTIDMDEQSEYKETLITQRLFVANDAKADNALLMSVYAVAESLCAFMVAPINLDGQLFGVLCIEQHKNESYPERRVWTKEEQDFASSLADFMTIVITNVKRHTLMRRTQTMLTNLPGMAYQCESFERGLIFTFVSNGSYELLGYTPDELLGKNANILLKKIHRDDINTFLEHRRALFEDGTPFETVVRVNMENDSVKWLWEFSRVVESNTDGTPLLLEGFITDITEQRQLKMAEEDHKRLAVMFDTIPLICLLWSLDNQVIDCNKEALRIFDMEKRDLINQFHTLTPGYQPDGTLSVEKSRSMFETAVKEGTVTFEWMHRKLDGTMIPVEVTLTRVEYGDDFAIFGYGRDLRKYNRLLEDITYQNNLLETMNNISHVLYEPDVERIDKNINTAMGMLSKSVDVDRMYIWQNKSIDDKLYATQIYEWSENVEPQQDKDFVVDMPYDEVAPQWEDELKNGRCINKIVRDMPDALREQMEAQGIISVLIVPVMLHEDFWGFIGFDDCNRERFFTEYEELILRSASKLISFALIRKKMMRDIMATTNRLEKLNEMSVRFLSFYEESFDAKMAAGIQIIADVANIDRLSIWRNTKMHDMIHTTKIYRWEVEKGGSIPPEDEFINVPLNQISSHWDRILAGELVINGPVSQIQDETIKKLLEYHEVMSTLVTPISFDSENDIWGFVIYEDRCRERFFDENAVEAMRSAAYLCVNTVMMKEMEKDLETALKEATDASRIKSDFLAKMSHEIRTPMNAIVGITELALREDMSDIVREHATTVKQAATNLLSIINDILDLSKIESGTMQIIPVPYLLSSMINDVVNIIRMRAVDSQLRFVVNVDSNLPNMLVGDETRIRQILINLLGNAVKYTDNGYVSFNVSGHAADEETLMLVMAVEDSGRGIKPKDIEKLFRSYYQVETESKSTDGIGLGLAITWNIVKTMNGNITVNSEFGVGSKFVVNLPQKIHKREKLAKVENPNTKSVVYYERREKYAESLFNTINNLGVNCELVDEVENLRAIVEKDKFSYIFLANGLFRKHKDALMEFIDMKQIVLLIEFGESAPVGNWNVIYMPAHAMSVANLYNGETGGYSYSEQKETSARFTAPDAKLLIVDDINTNLKVASGLLLPYEMEVDLCKSGKEAIAAVQTKKYDIVFMDHRMPEMDGIEATGIIRALNDGTDYFQYLPIVALTANIIAGMSEMFLQNGFDDFLSKPIDTTHLNTILEKWIPKEKQIGAVRETDKGHKSKRNAGESMRIEGLDTTIGIQMTGGTAELYRETLATFYEDGLERIDKIKTCIEDENFPLFVTHVHALKSAAANIGADELSRTAGMLEEAAKNGDIEYLRANNNQFFAMLERMLKSINEKYLTHKKNIATDDFDRNEFAEDLNALRAAIRDMDAEVMNKSIYSLLKYQTSDKTKSLIRKISIHLLMAEFEEAEMLIDILSKI
ncbi:MAG: ATP-binding protein [Defluviitaleaceae bacterium]|nr:ATP-binding protein [Defluviitaleaceae bacterium]